MLALALPPPVPVETERLRLRFHVERRLRGRCWRSSRARTSRGCSRGARATPRRCASRWPRSSPPRAIEQDGDPFTLAIEDKASGAYLGDVTIWTNSHEHRQGEVGYVLHPDHHGRGYAAEAAGPLLELGFTRFGMRRVIGRLDARNAASARVLEKLGMRREAHLIENEWVSGEWQSELSYAILAAEWRALRASRGA